MAQASLKSLCAGKYDKYHFDYVRRVLKSKATAREVIPVSVLPEILRLDTDTWRLYWLPRDRHAIPSDRARESFNNRIAGNEALAGMTKGYRLGCIFGWAMRSHHVVFAMHHGVWPEGFIDHINGIRDDNRPCNLRTVTPAENARNTAIGTRNRSGHVGVCFCQREQKWMAFIWKNQRLKHLGYHDQIDDAISARKEAQIKMGFHENHGRPNAYHAQGDG